MKSELIFLLSINILASLLIGCGNKQETPKEEKHIVHSTAIKLSREAAKQIKLETETISLQPFKGYLSLTAKVITNQDNEALIGSLVQGRVHKVFVKAGDFVKTGQILMTVEGLDVGEIKAGFLKAKANLDYTKSNYERQKKLFDEKIGAQKILLESRAEYEKALAEFKAEDKKIHSVGLSDDDVINGKSGDDHTSGTLPIKSSISGIVAERNVVVGQAVDASVNAFRIININSIWIDGQMYEKDLAKISRKTNVVFTSATYAHEKFTGKIIYIGQTVDAQTRTITVRGEFNNPAGKLKPQMFGELKIPVSEGVKALTVPEEAVVKGTTEQYVFVQTGDSLFEQRIVAAGSAVDGRIEIKEGLKEGDKVVSKGVFYLKSELKKDELEGDEH